MITLQARNLQSTWDKTRGLIGSKQPHIVFFQTRWGIHTWGVTFPIDVVILDTTYTVVKLKQNLKPHSFFFWNPKYFHVLELPEGTIQKLHIKLDLKINLQK